MEVNPAKGDTTLEEVLDKSYDEEPAMIEKLLYHCSDLFIKQRRRFKQKILTAPVTSPIQLGIVKDLLDLHSSGYKASNSPQGKPF